MAARQDEEVLDLLNGVLHGIKARMHKALRADGDELAPMEARALNYVARHPGCTQADIVQHSGRDKAQIARLIKHLLDRELLQRESIATDRRSHCLALTAAGRVLQKKVKQHRQRLAADLVTDLDAQERVQLMGLLQRLQASLEHDAD